MAYVAKTRKEDLVLSPFEMKFRGHKKTDRVQMSVLEISDAEVKDTQVYEIEEMAFCKECHHLVWFNMDGLHDETLVSKVSQFFDIPPGITWNILDPTMRAQIEDFPAGLFITLKVLRMNEATGKTQTENINIIIKENVLLTFHEQRNNIFDSLRERIKENKSKVRTKGADYLAFVLLDIIIDNYTYILGHYGNKVEKLEEEITLNAEKEILYVINRLKKELNHLRRDIKPTKQMILGLVKFETNLIYEENKDNYKELLENINYASEQMDYYREILYATLDIYHSSMSTRLNDIMALLTVFSVVFIPLTFIAGVYGMNFANMPELHYKNAYFVVMGGMILIGIIMLWYFKKRKWF